MPAHLGDEAAAGFQCAMHAAQRGILIAHPVQGGVGEDRIELPVEVQCLCTKKTGREPARLSGCNHLRRSVDSGNSRAGGSDLFRQRAIAAAEVENALAALRIEKFKDSACEIGNEAARLRILRSIPCLLCGHSDCTGSSVRSSTRPTSFCMKGSA